MSWYQLSTLDYDSQIISLVDPNDWNENDSYRFRRELKCKLPHMVFVWETGKVHRDFVNVFNTFGLTLVSERAKNIIMHECRGISFEPVVMRSDKDVLSYYFPRFIGRFEILCYSKCEVSGQFARLTDPRIKGVDATGLDAIVGPAFLGDAHLVKLLVSEKFVSALKRHKLSGWRATPLEEVVANCMATDTTRFVCQ